MTGSNYTCLSLSIEEGVARLVMTRPDVLNRFDEPLHEEFPRALQEVNDAPDVRVLTILAEGKAFAAGGDYAMIKRAHGSRELRDRLVREGMGIVRGIADAPFPVIVGVQGAAIGLGATIVSLADIVVAWRKAKIADPHVRLGLAPGDGGVVGWSTSVGLQRAKRYLLTGDAIDGEQAYAMGLVTDLVDTPEQVSARAGEIAARIAALPRNGVRGAKKAFAALFGRQAGAVLELGFAYEMDGMTDPEVLAAVETAQKK